jgi:hypothetical protein
MQCANLKAIAVEVPPRQAPSAHVESDCPEHTCGFGSKCCEAFAVDREQAHLSASSQRPYRVHRTIAAPAEAEAIGDVIVRVHDRLSLSERTARWSAEDATRLSLATSLHILPEELRGRVC